MDKGRIGSDIVGLNFFEYARLKNKIFQQKISQLCARNPGLIYRHERREKIASNKDKKVEKEKTKLKRQEMKDLNK